MNMPTRAFLQHYKLSISTLSPVHIGCGEDYEPTNYVMDDQCLHGFDLFGLADVLTEDDRKQLGQINSSKSPLLALQKYFYDRKEILIAQKNVTRLVAFDLFKKYGNVVGKAANVEQGGKQVINALEIARTSYNSHTQMPIIPGSSLKGAIRTALLNKRNEGKPTSLRPKELEKDLLDGAFQTDPMRLVKIADASFNEIPTTLHPRIAFENNVKRIPPTHNILSLMREVIPEFNYQAFTAELSIQDLLGIKTESTPNLKVSAGGIAKACNNFYLEIFKRELVRFLQRGCVQQAWAQRAKTLLELLAPFVAADAGMVLRVGRHSGAESVTLDGVRSIKIMKGRGKPAAYEKQATRDWLVGDQEKSEVNLMPFGWIFIDLGFSELNSAREKLQNFMLECSAHAVNEQNEAFEKVASRLDVLSKQKNELLEKEAQRHQKKIIQEQAELARQALLAAMPPESQEIHKMRVRIENGEDKGQGASCKLADDLRVLCESAASWSPPLKDELYQFALDVLLHLNIDRKKNDKWKARLNQLKAQ